MKTALILLCILGMASAFSMKNFHRRIKAEDSEENGVFKYRPRYFLYKHAYFYPPLKRFPVQGGSDSSEENGDGDSSEEEGEEEETSNEEENNEDSEGNEDQEAEAENATLSGVTASYGVETTADAGKLELAALQLPKKIQQDIHFGGHELFCSVMPALHGHGVGPSLAPHSSWPTLTKSDSLTAQFTKPAWNSLLSALETRALKQEKENLRGRSK